MMFIDFYWAIVVATKKPILRFVVSQISQFFGFGQVLPIPFRFNFSTLLGQHFIVVLLVCFFTFLVWPKVVGGFFFLHLDLHSKWKSRFRQAKQLITVLMGNLIATAPL
jgi:hypothetical protein